MKYMKMTMVQENGTNYKVDIQISEFGERMMKPHGLTNCN